MFNGLVGKPAGNQHIWCLGGPRRAVSFFTSFPLIFQWVKLSQTLKAYDVYWFSMYFPMYLVYLRLVQGWLNHAKSISAIGTEGMKHFQSPCLMSIDWDEHLPESTRYLSFFNKKQGFSHSTCPQLKLSFYVTSWDGPKILFVFPEVTGIEDLGIPLLSSGITECYPSRTPPLRGIPVNGKFLWNMAWVAISSQTVAGSVRWLDDLYDLDICLLYPLVNVYITMENHHF